MCLHVEDGLPSLYTFVSKNVIIVSDISAVNLIVLTKSFTDLSNKAFYFVSDCVPQGEDIVNVSFPHKRFSWTLSWVSFSIMKKLAKPRPLWCPFLYHGFVGSFFHGTGIVCSERQSISFKNFVGNDRSSW